MEKFNFTKPNVTFHQGYIEDLKQIATASVDVVVSNCVVNLSPRKDLVMQEVFRILKEGGEFYFSDVFVDRRLPDEIAFDTVLHSECLGDKIHIFKASFFDKIHTMKTSFFIKFTFSKSHF